MMNVLTITGGTPKVDIMLEIYRTKFSSLPAKLPINGKAEDVKAFYFPEKMLPAGLKPYYVSTEGTLVVTHYDPVSRVISGTFSFKATRFDPKSLKSVPGDVVEVTQGSFEGVTYKKI